MGRYSKEQMKGFFSPRNVAVVGASENNQWFRNIIKNAAEAGFEGALYPVNPRGGEVCGIRACRGVEELPEGVIDLAVIIVKSSLVLETIEKLRKKGVTNVLLVTSGFAEMGDEGVAAQVELKRYCLEQGIVLMGPNCLGFVHPTEKGSIFGGSAFEAKPFPGSVGIIAQSGATSEVIATKILRKSLGISLYVTTGNEALVGAEDCMEYLVHDGHTRVITGFIEEFRDIEKLKTVAREAAGKKIPIIILKIGRSEKGKKAASSHTGALAGNTRIADGLFRQFGIIQVETIEELVETAAIFSRCNIPEGKGVGICTASGGISGLYADLCDTCGIDVPPLQEKTRKTLAALLPQFAQPDNPLDVTGSGFLRGLNRILQVMVDDDHFDLIVTLSIPPHGDDDSFASAVNDSFMPLLKTAKKPIVPFTFRELTDYGREYYLSRECYFVEHPSIGFKALAHLIGYGEFLRKRKFQSETGLME